MGLTDEELAQKRQRVADLTAQLEAARDANATTLREKENEIEGARLDAAAINLEAQLAALMAAGEQKRIDAANEPVLAQADKEMVQAVEFHEARVASEEARDEAAREAKENPPNPEDVGVAADELERRRKAAEEADKEPDKEPEAITPPAQPPTPTLPSAPTTDDEKNEGGND